MKTFLASPFDKFLTSLMMPAKVFCRFFTSLRPDQIQRFASGLVRYVEAWAKAWLLRFCWYYWWRSFCNGFVKLLVLCHCDLQKQKLGRRSIYLCLASVASSPLNVLFQIGFSLGRKLVLVRDVFFLVSLFWAEELYGTGRFYSLCVFGRRVSWKPFLCR